MCLTNREKRPQNFDIQLTGNITASPSECIWDFLIFLSILHSPSPLEIKTMCLAESWSGMLAADTSIMWSAYFHPQGHRSRKLNSWMHFNFPFFVLFLFLESGKNEFKKFHFKFFGKFHFTRNLDFSENWKINSLNCHFFMKKLRICSCLACVYRVMDARGKFREHEKCMSSSRRSREQIYLFESSPNFPSASITRYTHS